MPPLKGDSNNPNVPAVWGQQTGDGGSGVFGQDDSVRGGGVIGHSQNGRGVYGESLGSGTGVWGFSQSNNGVVGESRLAEGVRGVSHNPNNGAVVGVCDQTNGTGVFGTCDDGKGGAGKGVWGFSNGTGWGVIGESQGYEGVRGISHNPNHGGVVGTSDAVGGGTGVFGTAAGTGVVGRRGSADPPVLLTGGVVGFSTDVAGVTGMSTASGGIWGGVSGTNPNGSGVRGVGLTGLSGQGLKPDGTSGTGVFGLGNPGVFSWGDCQVFGSLIVTQNKQFQIDHPLDPANKYLNHFSVESSQAKNVYDGSVVLDVKGEAVVELPAWFEALNVDFRYQLTPIGRHAPLYVSRKLTDNRFTIAGGEAGMEVCWQVTGVRHDAYARSHPTAVEQEKLAEERGYYLDPTSHGAPKERGVSWARYPDMMKEGNRGLQK